MLHPVASRPQDDLLPFPARAVDNQGLARRWVKILTRRKTVGRYDWSMTLPRTIRRQRPLAWLGLVAILLLSIVPTISQVVASLAIRSDNASTSQHHVAHEASQHDHAGEPCPDGKRGDHWQKCGYCDFLAHTPALGHVAYCPQFCVSLPPVLVSAGTPQRARSAYFLAAQPRGPPGFLA